MHAMKFTKPGGTVSVRIVQLPGAPKGYANYEFRIKDTGIGMSKEFLKHIFEPFERERTSTVSGIQGTGLGMAITKNIVDMMGGTIHVESEEGKGSEFTVIIPCRICDEAPCESDKTAAPAVLPVADFSGKRVLLAEDNEMNQMIARAILEETGLITYSHGEYFSLGKKLGKFGYSVQKRK